MIVKNLLELMAHNPGLQLTIYDNTVEVITFEASGYEAISDTIGNREISKITIAETGTNHIKIYLKSLIDNTP